MGLVGVIPREGILFSAHELLHIQENVISKKTNTASLSIFLWI